MPGVIGCALGRLALCGNFFRVEIAVGLRHGVHRQYAVFACHDTQIIEQDDAGEFGDVARECAQIMIVAVDFQVDRSFCIKLGHILCWCRLEKIELQTAP